MIMSLDDIPKQIALGGLVILLVPLVVEAMNQEPVMEKTTTVIGSESFENAFDKAWERRAQKPVEKKKKTVSHSQIESYIRKVFYETPDIAVAVAHAESNLIECAHGDKNNKLATKGSWGIFQINVAVHTDKIRGDVCDWKDNIDIARKIYLEAGKKWTPWGAYTDGRYKEYL